MRTMPKSMPMPIQNPRPPTCRLFDLAILDDAHVVRDPSQDAYQVTLPDQRRLQFSRSVREGWAVHLEVQGVTADGESVRPVDLDVDQLDGVQPFWSQLGKLAWQQSQQRRRYLLEQFQDLFQ